MIRSIDAFSARSISSTQVITSLSSIVKELVENGFDAEAANVEVLVHTMPPDSNSNNDSSTVYPTITVRDDGVGMALCTGDEILVQRSSSKQHSNREEKRKDDDDSGDGLIALGKHSSRGFRGEALYSIGALAHVELTTKPQASDDNAEHGHAMRLVYEAGELVSATHGTSCIELPPNFAHGTIVKVYSIYHNVPVRRQELMKNLRKHITGIAQVSRQLALSRPTVRLYAAHHQVVSTSTTTNSSSASTQLLCHSTGSRSASLLQVVGDVLGGRIAASLFDVTWTTDDKEDDHQQQEHGAANRPSWSAHGYLSKVREGRANADWTFLFMDGRPVEIPKCAKAIADSYRACHPNMATRVFPVIVLWITSLSSTSASPGSATRASRYDVNLAPDKRKILIEDEGTLVEWLRRKSLDAFQLSSNIFLTQVKDAAFRGTQRQIDQHQRVLFNTALVAPPTQRPVAGLGALPFPTEQQLQQQQQQQQAVHGASTYGGNATDTEGKGAHTTLAVMSQWAFSAKKREREVDDVNGNCSNDSNSVAGAALTATTNHDDDRVGKDAEQQIGAIAGTAIATATSQTDIPTSPSHATLTEGASSILTSPGASFLATPQHQQLQCAQAASALSSNSAVLGSPHELSTSSLHGASIVTLTDADVQCGASPGTQEPPAVLALSGVHCFRTGKVEDANATRRDSDDEDFAEEEETESMKHRQGGSNNKKKKGRKGPKKRKKLWSKMTSAKCEDELQSGLHKDVFEKMIVHGQFNKGFIIASYDGDLFIIDQHASDEKYNYERLKDSFVPKPQRLVRPCVVRVDEAEAELIGQHVGELASHGFLVSVPAQQVMLNIDGVRTTSRDNEKSQQEEAQLSGSVIVSGVPVLPYDTVAPHDVLELTEQLVSYGKIVRPLKMVWHSLATKACRHSVMIGRTLSSGQMESILSRMSKLDAPWNCPHGRPTMRHLISLQFDDGNAEQ